MRWTTPTAASSSVKVLCEGGHVRLSRRDFFLGAGGTAVGVAGIPGVGTSANAPVPQSSEKVDLRSLICRPLFAPGTPSSIATVQVAAAGLGGP
jgi:hypothetical protein